MADGLASLEAAARSLLPAEVAVAAAGLATSPPSPFPVEILANAVPKRQREFAVGRHAARAALAQLGVAAMPLPMGPDRVPLWPQGIHGSITHSASLCLAAACRAPRLIGIDLEPATPLDPELWETILLPEEIAALAGLQNASSLAKLIFSAKEASFKAQYAASKTLFGFEMIRVTLGHNSFTAAFTNSVPGFERGSQLQGRFTTVAGHFLTTVTR
jgi:4'-phosphopantetheinyl transferase EntD